MKTLYCSHGSNYPAGRERAMAAASDEAHFVEWMTENNIKYQTPFLCLCCVEAQLALQSQSNRETAMTAYDEAK
ncbi:hypothetical protein QVD17_39224 [Tagetes erecta]|uniref:Uncharacterized protein n=1 Tax=Tagetes erecta TaxID=13708 RepID=A0AAD8JN64_TARER|nr:hypothetical protein QVD17_39224 [Tagetes erecta]